MRRYIAINEDFFDDVDQQELISDEIDDIKGDDIIPKDLVEHMYIDFETHGSDLNSITTSLKKLEPMIRYGLDCWRGFKYHNKFEYSFTSSDNRALKPASETTTIDGIKYNDIQNRYTRGSFLRLDIICLFNTNNPKLIINFLSFLFNKVHKSNVNLEIKIVRFVNDEEKEASISKMIFNFAHDNKMKIDRMSKIFNVAIGIDGCMGKYYKYTNTSPIQMYYKAKSDALASRLKTNGATRKLYNLYKLAENVDISNIAGSLDDIINQFKLITIYDPIEGESIRTYSCLKKNPYYSFIKDNSEVAGDIDIFIKNCNVKCDIYLAKSTISSVVTFVVDPKSTIVCDYYNDVRESEDDEQNPDEIAYPEVALTFEVAGGNSFINIDGSKEPTECDFFRMIMKYGKMSLDEAISVFVSEMEDLSEEKIEILHKWIEEK